MAKYFDYPHICFDVGNKYIAPGALTNSKKPSQFVDGVYPYVDPRFCKAFNKLLLLV